MQPFWNAFYVVAAMLLWPRWTWRALTRGEYVAGFWQKLTGRPPRLPDDRPVLWMHAVCIGEVLLLRPLIEHVQRHIPDHQIVLSTFSSSGMQAARKAYPTVSVCYVPFDFTWTVRRVYGAFRPRLLLLSELELWPNLLLEARRRGVPVMVASSRINDADLQFYRRINRWHRPALRSITWWGTQTERDARRVAELLGPDPLTQITVTGSLKYDAAAGLAECRTAAALRRQLGYAESDRILVAGSTHDPEERMVLDVFLRLRQRRPQLKLLLAPRERHRFTAVAGLIAQRGLSCVPRSAVTAPLLSPPDVVLLDTVGELPEMWSIADYGFIGGTWAPGIGGQSPIEPASLGKPVCLGPHVWNFEQPAQGLIAAGAAVQVQSPEQLAAAIDGWIEHPERAQEMGRAAAEFARSQQGAAATTVRAVLKVLGVVDVAHD